MLDEKLDVMGNVMLGVAETKALLDRFEAVSAKFAEEMSDDEMTALLAEQAELQEKIDHLNAWELTRQVEIAMDALRCPPGDAKVDKLSGGERRRIALCRLLLSSRSAAARRTDQPSRRRVGGLARTASARIHGHGGDRHP